MRRREIRWNATGLSNRSFRYIIYYYRSPLLYMAHNDIYTQTKSILDSADKICICVNNRSSFDTHLAAAALYLYLQSKGKSTVFYSNGGLILRHRQMIEDQGIEVSEDLKPLSYVVTINHAEGDIEKVSYDDKDGKFRLYITPAEKSKSFDFKKVSYSEAGGDFDAIVVFGTRMLSWLGDLYKQHTDLFEKKPVVNINNVSGVQEYGTVRLVDTEISVSEIVYELISSSESSIRLVLNLLLMGVLDNVQLLQVSEYKASTIETISRIVASGADLKESIRKLYYERTLENFEIVRRVMNNMKIDQEHGLAWSTVSSFDFSQSGVDREQFTLDGRIIFNVCAAFNVAFVLYEVQEGEIVIELESNLRTLSAKELLSGYKTSGNSARVFCTVRGKPLAELEEEIIALITPKLSSSTDKATEAIPVKEKISKVSPDHVDSETSVEKTGLTEDTSVVDNTQSTHSLSEDIEEDAGSVGLVTPPPISTEEPE